MQRAKRCSGLPEKPGQMLGGRTFSLGFRPVARLQGLEQGAGDHKGAAVSEGAVPRSSTWALKPEDLS